MLRYKAIKLLVLDSLAAIIRSEYALAEMVERADLLWRMSTKLKQIAARYDMAVVLVNQVCLCG